MRGLCARCTRVVVGQGDSYEAALADVRSALQFHLETFAQDKEFIEFYEASKDPLFMADLREVMDDFKHADFDSIFK